MIKGTACRLDLLIVGLLVFATFQGRANTLEVDWTANGFSTSQITIDAGDEVDIVNMDDTFDLLVTGAPPEYFSADVSPTDGVDTYYLAYVYNNVGNFSFSDEFGNSVAVTVNPPLLVTITSPTNNAVFTAPATFPVTALPSGGTTPYIEVDFYLGTNLQDVVFASPFTTTISNVPAGNYVLTAVVFDSDINAASNSISVSVVAPPPISTNDILPVSCAAIYPASIITNSYLSVGSSIHGGLEFAAFDSGQYSSILLEINPYGLPLYGTNISVYGFDDGTGALTVSNYNSGTLLGVWALPATLGYGQVTTFDVTAFVKSTTGSYFGFILQSPGNDLFSSTSVNDGTPPELFAIASPMPPQLSVVSAVNQIIISWPTNNSAGLSLQTSPNLGAGASWSVVTPAVLGNQWVVTNSTSGVSQFFRLSPQ